MSIMLGGIIGFVTWFLLRYLVAGLYTVNQNERAVKTSFGRAQRLGQATTLGTYELVGGGWENAEAFTRRVRAVTPADIQRVAREVFRPANGTVVTLSHGGQADQPAAAKGGN